MYNLVLTFLEGMASELSLYSVSSSSANSSSRSATCGWEQEWQMATEAHDWLKGKKGWRRRRCATLRQEPVRSKLPWPPRPPAGARAHPTGREVCSQTSVRRHPAIWPSTAASDWSSSPPRPKSFCHCRQESAERSDSHASLTGCIEVEWNQVLKGWQIC